MSAQIEPLLTNANLECMPQDGNRYELIEGEIYVSSAPNLRHQGISVNITTAFRYFLDENPIGKVYAAPGVIFSDYSGVIPDVVYFSNERRAEIAAGDRIYGAPDIIVEILSPGKENVERDRVFKRQLYGKYGVKEYWMIVPEERTIEVYRLARRTLKLAATLSESDTITSLQLPGFSCQVAKIFQS